MTTEVRLPAFSDQEMFKSQIVGRPPLEQGTPRGLLASPANGGLKGRVNGTIGVKLPLV